MYIADLHIHSRFSRATSRDGDAPHLDLWARRKGIGLLGTGGIDKALDIFHPRNIRTYIKTLGNDPETRQILSAEFQNLMEAAKRTRIQPGDAKTLPEGK